MNNNKKYPYTHDEVVDVFNVVYASPTYEEKSSGADSLIIGEVYNSPIVDYSQVKLLLQSTGMVIQIWDNQFLAGRSSECKLIFNNALNMISRLHAKFICENNNWYIEDRSTNGTWVNDFKLMPKIKYRLNSGDCINFANSEKVIFQIIGG